MRHWDHPQQWKAHVDPCVHEYWLQNFNGGGGEALQCPDPRCEGEYATELELRFHLCDRHGIKFVNSRAAQGRGKSKKIVDQPRHAGTYRFVYDTRGQSPSSSAVTKTEPSRSELKSILSFSTDCRDIFPVDMQQDLTHNPVAFSSSDPEGTTSNDHKPGTGDSKNISQPANRILETSPPNQGRLGRFFSQLLASSFSID
jgi:hypothetical protein